MKSHKFLWFIIPLALATATVMHFASCDDSTDEIKPNTETVAPATDDDNTNSDLEDVAVTSRAGCFCASESDCPIDIDMTSGDASLTICGITNNTTSCAATSTNCGTTYPGQATFSPTSDMCICVPSGRPFIVTNNSNAAVVITLTVDGTYPLPTQTIPANSSVIFGTPADCDDVVFVCP